MKEALMVMGSAWSIVLIALFVIFALSQVPAPSDHPEARADVITLLFVGAVTGAGWLWYRSQVKRSRA